METLEQRINKAGGVINKALEENSLSIVPVLNYTKEGVMIALQFVDNLAKQNNKETTKKDESQPSV